MNHFIELLLKNRLLIGILTLIIFVAGIYSYINLPVDAFPDVSPSLVQVFTVTEGLAPEEVEKYITYPVEAAMNGLPKLEKIRSVSNFGLSVVNIYFKDGTDIYFARQLVGERLLEAREQIPTGFGDPHMGPIATGQGQVLYYYLRDRNKQYSLTELRTIQDWIIKYNLQTIPNVTEVLGIGGWEKQYQIRIDPVALLKYDVTLSQVLDAIKANNLNVGAQYIEKNGEQYIVRSEGLATGIEDLETIIIKSIDGKPILLRALAKIETGGAIRRGLQTRNGEEETVAGMVIKLVGSNSSTVIEAVEKKLEEISKTLPEGVEIVPFYEQKSLVDASVRTVTRALLQGIVLVLLVLLLFMQSLRPSIVVALAIPFSLFFAFIFMRYFDISANLMSFGGLAIAIGMLVDGTIVMVENTDRLLKGQQTASCFQIISQSFKQVARPILFAISIIIIVFLPLFTLQGVEGKTFRPLAFTIALAMIGSLLFALVISPVISSLVMRKGKAGHKKGLITRVLQHIYEPLIIFFIRHRLTALITALLLVLSGLVIYPQLGSEFTPRLNEGELLVNLTFSPSISIEETKRNILRIEKRFLKIPEVEEVVSRIGRGEVGAHSAPVNVSHMNVILKPEKEWSEHQTQEQIEDALREQLATYPGVLTNITQPIQLSVDELISGIKAELAIKLFGEEINILKERADEIAAQLRTIPGAADVQVEQMTGAPQLVIRPDRAAISRHGINISDVQEVIHAAVGGVNVGQIFEGIRRFDVNVRYAKNSRDSKNAIGNILIPGPNGIRVPLQQIADIREVVGPRQILRENNQRFITVQCNVVDRDIGSFVAEAQKWIEESIELPPGYYITWGGQFELQQKANKRLAWVVPFSILLISLLLYMSFGSVKNTLLILLNIPLALVGGITALWIGGENLSVPALVGFIALFGIALENGMVLVSNLNQLLREGCELNQACLKGAMQRMRPVLMTAFTTALGLIPLLLATGTGSEVQRPLATVVIGGLVTSTLLTLLIIPSLYKWFAIEKVRIEK
ncbi:CusA/CzcA family heavy metal efflux RND transporter [candidate division KSB1 bacterium]|nr:CusA/CzcA family heavy metal efflux RND transporter [candidate division KSB1 bacterium]